MKARTLIIPVAAAGFLIAGALPASAAVSQTINASDSGTATLLGPTQAARCRLDNPTQAADLRCRYLTTTRFRNGQLHGVTQGIATIDFTHVSSDPVSCGTMSGRFTVSVFRNSNGKFIGSYVDQLRPGAQVCPTFLPDTLTQSFEADVLGGTGVFAHQRGLVQGRTVSMSSVTPNGPSQLIGKFSATLHP